MLIQKPNSLLLLYLWSAIRWQKSYKYYYYTLNMHKNNVHIYFDTHMHFFR